MFEEEKLENVGKCLIGKPLSMVRSGMMKTFMTSYPLKPNSQLSDETLSCEPTVISFNDNEIEFRISFDESDDEDYTVNMPLFPSPEPTVSYFDDLNFLKDFEKEFPAIVYNDALTSKSDFLIEPTINPQHIDELNLKYETSLSESIFMYTAYGGRWIRRIGNCEYAFSCEDLALIRRISFPGSWIKACLESSRASVFVNGSPTYEFSPKRGLRHGDPLSHFLFILIMEGLHVALSNAVTSGSQDSEKIAWVKCGTGDCFLILTSYGSRLSKRCMAKKAVLISLGAKQMKDAWLGNYPLYLWFNRLSRLEQDKDYLIIDRISYGQWRWIFSRADLGVRNSAYLRDTLNEISQIDIIFDKDACVSSLSNDGVFSVGATRMHIDNLLLPSLDPTTTWDKTAPRKVNIYMSRLKLD
nr:reverse transcriptase domain, reverse transcriptase zinc-binding domain protein [Tanacetum cinerariifolium]